MQAPVSATAPPAPSFPVGALGGRSERPSSRLLRYGTRGLQWGQDVSESAILPYVPRMPRFAGDGR